MSSKITLVILFQIFQDKQRNALALKCMPNYKFIAYKDHLIERFIAVDRKSNLTQKGEVAGHCPNL